LEPYSDRGRRQPWGVIVHLPVTNSWLGGGPVRLSPDFGGKHVDPRISDGISGVGDYSGPFLYRIRHGKSYISRSGTDWIWGIDLQMVHKKKRQGDRTYISCRSARRYRNRLGSLVGHIALEHWESVDFPGCLGARHLRAAVRIIDR